MMYQHRSSIAKRIRIRDDAVVVVKSTSFLLLLGSFKASQQAHDELRTDGLVDF
jgi:hypothetical protein